MHKETLRAFSDRFHELIEERGGSEGASAFFAELTSRIEASGRTKSDVVGQALELFIEADRPFGRADINSEEAEALARRWAALMPIGGVAVGGQIEVQETMRDALMHSAPNPTRMGCNGFWGCSAGWVL